MVPALTCGNAVVWKPAEYSPAIGDALAQLFIHAGLLDGVLNVVQAEGPAAFEGLERALDEGLVDKVGFTGSSAVGQKIGELCGRHMQSPCLELGGKNPLVVMPDANLDLAVEGALFSGFGTAGQRCTSLGTAIVHESARRVPHPLLRAVEEAKIGDPTQDVLYGPMLSQRFHDRFIGWLELIEGHHAISGSSGMGTITRDNPRSGFVGDPEAGIYCHPTIVDGVTMDDELYRTETFGPIVGVAEFSTFDEAVALSNNHTGSRRRSHARRRERAALPREEHRRDALRQQLNQRGEAHLPFGGNGKSGNGSRLGDLGPRPVHPLAGDELGLRGQAPEGPDGHSRAARRPRLHAARGGAREGRGLTHDVIVAGLGGWAAPPPTSSQAGVSVSGWRGSPGPIEAPATAARASSAGLLRRVRVRPLLLRAYELWEQLEEETGQRLMTLTGGLMIGREDGELVSGSVRSAEEHGLPRDARRRRDPAPLRLRPRPRNRRSLRGEGRLRPPRRDRQGPPRPRELFRRRPAFRGAGSLVGGVRDGVRVETPKSTTRRGDSSSHRAPGPSAAADLDLPLEVIRQVMFWYEPKNGLEPFLPERFPIFIWEPEDGNMFYGFRPRTLIGCPAAFFRAGGVPTSPDTIDREVHEEEIGFLRGYLAEHVPELAGRCLDARACMYTNTPTSTS